MYNIRVIMYSIFLTLDVAPACAEGGPCISSSSQNKSLQCDNSSLSPTAAMNGARDNEVDEKKYLIKRNPVTT